MHYELFITLDLSFVNGIKQQFEVYLRLCTTLLTRCNHSISLERRLSIECILHLVRCAILKGVLFSNLSHISIEQQLLLREDQDMIQQRLDVMYLMGRDNQRAIALYKDIRCIHFNKNASFQTFSVSPFFTFALP